MQREHTQKKMEQSARVEKLLSSMTLEEKVAQMIQIPYAYVGREQALAWAKKGAGSFLHILGDDAREIQRTALENGHAIPVLFGIDAIHGHGINEHATIFPSQLAMACSWDREQIREMGRITAKEVAADGLHWTFSPVLCLGRDTRWGRVDETFGEDSYLSGELGAAIIRGYQGEDLKNPESILACAKHYIGYGEAVGARDACDTEMTYRKLRDVFLPPFAKAVEAGCATFMTAYGSIDGEPFTASKKALKDILREELGFDGFVVTDWDNVNSLVINQHVAENLEEASCLAAEAGNDMIMYTEDFYQAAIAMVKAGKLQESVIDDAVRHILQVKERMGLFDCPEREVPTSCIGCEEHLSMNEQLAESCVVLLKNDGVLPIADSVKKIAVIGPNADDIRAQYGDWTYFTHPQPKPDQVPVRPYVTLLEGIRELAGPDVLVVYEKGCNVLPVEADAAAETDDDIAKAVKAAEDSDLIVLAIGDVVEQAGEYRDRANLALSGGQMKLFRALKATGKKLVTVLISTKPLCVEEAATGSDAFLVAFNGGMFGGRAVSHALFGKTNPSGKLPISFPRHVGQLPVYYNSLPGWHGGKYVDLPETPLFAFGEGMGYSAFRYGNLRVEETEGETYLVSVEVTNTGERDGEEIVQVYFHDVCSSIMTPVKQLIRFEKATIPAKQTAAFTFLLKREDFSFVDRTEKRVTEPGEIQIMVGASSKDEDLLKTVIRLR